MASGHRSDSHLAKSLWFLVGSISSSIVFAACSGVAADVDTAPPVSLGIHRVIVDYSPTVSDIGGLMYLLSHPSVDVVAVTLPGTGEAGCELGVEVTIRLLGILGHPQIPVACDPEIPPDAHRWPDEFLAGQNQLVEILDPVSVRSTQLSPADLISNIAAEPGPPLLIYAVAPLTNIARALESHPELTETVDQIVVMGGAVDTQGNVEGRNAEWNFWIDPRAAATVLQSGIPTILVSLDATNDVPVPSGYQARLETVEQTPAIAYLAELVDTFPGVTGGFFYMWDELAAMVAAGESIVMTEAVIIEIGDSGPNEARTVRSDSGSPVTLVTGVPDPETFYAKFLGQLASPGPSDG